MTQERSAALLIRVWLEGDDGFRARVLSIDPAADGRERTVAVASTHGEVVDAVRHWLEEFSGRGAQPD
ncbi:hypothetical protein ACI797_11700 [Geodermatophilus sp. SYSU D00691]